jgi:sugar lactone lactonase YvrE
MGRLKFSLAIILFNFYLIAPLAVRAADAVEIKTVQPKQVVALTDGSELRVRLVAKKKFQKNSKVIVNGTELPDNKVNLQDGELLALIPANLVSQPGSISISVRSKDGKVSNSVSVSVIPPTGVNITAIRPRVVIAGQVPQAFGIMAQGENFDGKAIVRVGGVKTNSEVRRKGEFSIIIGTVDPREVDFAGSVPIQIENGDGTISNTFNIIITPPGPTLDDVEPSNADIGSGTTKITLTGGIYYPTSKVLINDQVVPSQLKGKNAIKRGFGDTLEATVPAEFFTQLGQLPVQVINEGIGDSQTLLLSVKPLKVPIIYSLNPAAIPAGSKDFDLIIVGENFKDTKNVLVNGSKIEFTEVTKALLKITLKAKDISSPGKLDLQVVTKDGNSNTQSLNIDTASTTTTIAGNVPGFQDGTENKALFANPAFAAVAPDGMVYIADQANNAIRRLNPNTGEVVTIAGNPDGRPGFVDTADIDKDNPTVRFSNPIGIAIDQAGTLYITDFGNDVIRRLRFGTNNQVTVDTVAGRTKVVKNDDGSKERFGVEGFLDDTPDKSSFNGPYGITIDQQGNLFVADSFNNVIRQITFENGVAQSVSTVFGNGFPGLADGAGDSVQFNTPLGLFMQGNKLLVTDFRNNTIRQVDMAMSQVDVLVGLRRSLRSQALEQVDQNSPSFGDGTRFFAILSGPISTTADDSGNLYVADFDRNRIRRVSPDGTVTTIAGGSQGKDDGSGTKAEFNGPRFILFIGNNTLLVVDSGNSLIRKITLQ